MRPKPLSIPPASTIRLLISTMSTTTCSDSWKLKCFCHRRASSRPPPLSSRNRMNRVNSVGDGGRASCTFHCPGNTRPSRHSAPNRKRAKRKYWNECQLASQVLVSQAGTLAFTMLRRTEIGPPWPGQCFARGQIHPAAGAGHHIFISLHVTGGSGPFPAARRPPRPPDDQRQNADEQIFEHAVLGRPGVNPPLPPRR